MGEPGVGKSSLLDALLEDADRAGQHVVRFAATYATRELPFGALISLLPDGGGDRTQLLAGVRRRLTVNTGGGGLVIGIDDVHLLDEASLGCVADLVLHGDAVAVMTGRTTEEFPRDILRLRSSGLVERLSIQPFTQDETAQLMRELLGGEVDPEVVASWHELTGGLPLFIRELLLDAVEADNFVRGHDRWRLARHVRPGPRLREVVADRLASLDSHVRDLLELVAMGEPLSSALLRSDEYDALDELERRQLVRVAPDGESAEVIARVDHPLITEAVRAAGSTRRRRELWGSLVSRQCDAGIARRGDALRLAQWSALAGVDISASHALTAGREALSALDLELAARLAERARADEPFGSHRLLGQTRRLQGRAEEAETELSAAAELAVGDADVVEIAMWRSTLLAHHDGDPLAAIELLERAALHVGEPSMAIELTSEAAFLAGMLGRFDVALRVNEAILQTSGVEESARATSLVNLVYARTMLAQFADVDARLDESWRLASGRDDARPEALDLHGALRAGIAFQRGHLRSAELEIGELLRQWVDSGQLHGLTATILVETLLLRASPDLESVLAAALADLETADPFAARPLCLASAAVVAGVLGDEAALASRLDEITDEHRADVRAAPFIGRADAALAACRYGSEVGGEIAAECGRTAVATSHVSFGVLALYDAVMLGRAELVAEDLAAALVGSDAGLLLTMRDHAVAQTRRDVDGLADVAARFGAMGADAVLPFVYRDLSVAGRGIEARRSAAMSMLWDAATFGTLGRVEVADGVSLREADVLARAIEGAPSRTIAESLFISPRTVDNHLRSVYAKLEVSGREELTEVLCHGAGVPPRRRRDRQPRRSPLP